MLLHQMRATSRLLLVRSDVTITMAQMTDKELIENVKMAVNPKFENWALFSNGTYIIFDALDRNETIESKAMAMMKKYGPVTSGGPAGDFSVIHLNKIDGWSISGHGYGMYTYVHPSEISSSNPNNAEVGLFGRSKRHQDSVELTLIYINSNEKS